jgi:hypothetical protein
VGKSSRTRRRAALSKARRPRNTLPWYLLAGAIIVAGVVLIAMSRSDRERPLVNKDHWHAAFGVNVCGQWLPHAPEFHSDISNPRATAGVHSHGDGLIHIHPFVSAEAGEHATVGRFLAYGGWSADEDGFAVWDATGVHTEEDGCDGEPAQVRWSVNGQERRGDISDYRPRDQDVIALALLPEGEEIGTPPSAENVATPSDVEPQPGVTAPPGGGSSTTAGGGTTVPGAPTTTGGPPTTATTADGSPATSTP